MHLQIDVTRTGGYTVVSPQGEIDFATGPQLKDALTELLVAGEVNLVVDLLGVDFIESAIEQALEKRAALPDEVAARLSFRFADATRPSTLGRFGAIFDSGRIIAVGSVVGQMGNAGQANYAASKAGLIGFCKALAREVASRSITVNVVAPGLIETDMTRGLAGDAKQDWSKQIPLGRLGAPDDVAAAVCFLASDEASYITGHVLAVNGGMYT